MNAALREAFFGNASVARQRAVAARGLSKSRDLEYGVAFALAMAGHPSDAQTFADDLSRRFPEDTLVVSNYLPTLGGLLALNHSKPERAIELLQTAIPCELGQSESGVGNLYPAYVRGEAYLAAHHGAEAAAEFQKIIDHRGILKVRWHICNWEGHWRFQEIRAKPGAPTKTFSPSGTTPTRIFPSSCKLRRSMRSCSR